MIESKHSCVRSINVCVHAIALTAMMKGMGKGHSWSESISEPFLRRQRTFRGSPRCPASVRQDTLAGEDQWNGQEWTLFIMAGWAAVLMLWHNLGKSNPKKRGCSPSRWGGRGGRSGKPDCAHPWSGSSEWQSPLYSIRTEPWNNATQI